MIESPGVFWSILFFMVVIGPLVVIHELGHYLVARWCGVKSDVFSIGFGKELIGWTDKRGTRWKLAAIPMGGYVRFAGDENAASSPGEAWKELPEERRVHAYLAQPVWKRILISAAGPVANLLLAALIYMAMFGALGEYRLPPIAASIVPNSAAADAGIKAGDRILAIDGREMAGFDDLYDYIAIRAGQLMTFKIERAGKELQIVAAPREQELVSRFGTKAKRGLMGIGPGKPEHVDVGLLELPGKGISQVVRVVRNMAEGLGQIIMGYHSVKELGGPIMIAKLSGEMAAMGGVALLSFVALISINLGFINLLPVPMLDGGHLLFYTIEAIRRKPVSLATQEWAYRAGFLLVMGLMVFVTINDTLRFGVFDRLGGLIG
jgi:regulator of sigma E protease